MVVPYYEIQYYFFFDKILRIALNTWSFNRARRQIVGVVSSGFVAVRASDSSLRTSEGV